MPSNLSKYKLLLLFLGASFLNSCLITEIEPPSDKIASTHSSSTRNEFSSSSNVNPSSSSSVKLSSSSFEDFPTDTSHIETPNDSNNEIHTNIQIPDSLKAFYRHYEDLNKNASFHSIFDALPYKHEEKLLHWKDSLSILVFLKAPGDPCLQILKDLHFFYSELSETEKTFSIITMVYAYSTLEVLDYYLKESKSEFPVFIDHEMKFSNFFGTGFVPLIVILDGKGNAWRIEGGDRIHLLKTFLSLL